MKPLIAMALTLVLAACDDSAGQMATTRLKPAPGGATSAPATAPVEKVDPAAV